MNTRLQVQSKSETQSSLVRGQSDLLADRSPEQDELPLVPPILHDMLPIFQAKLTIGQPNDKYEQEADRVADQVMRMPEPKVQRVCSECEEELKQQPMEDEEEDTLQTKPLAEKFTPSIQRQAEPMEEDEEKVMMSSEEEDKTVQTKPTIEKLGASTGDTSSAFLNELESQKRLGFPLPSNVNKELSHKIGADFSNVRLHTDNRAIQMSQKMGAQAFAYGQDIYFNQGKYNPGKLTGQAFVGS